MRGEKVQEQMNKKVYGSAFSVVDPQGNVQYHVVSTWWAKGVMLGFLLFILIFTIIAILIFENQTQIQSLQQQVDNKEVQVDANRESSNSQDIHR